MGQGRQHKSEEKMEIEFNGSKKRSNKKRRGADEDEKQ